MKPKKQNKILIQDVLLTFYGKVRVMEDKEDCDDVLIGEFDYPPMEFCDRPYSWEATQDEDSGYGRLRLDNVLDKLQEVCKDNKDKYRSVELVWDVNDGYNSYHRIVGIREETDQEFTTRLKAIEDKEMAKAKKKEDDKKRILENKVKKLNKLKEELGVE